ncbi:MAG: septum formation initiator family protein [Oscillospiraceae bacterium]|nr:septum formation initiator family protein [Oscillospiraceae bacterium]
MKKEKKGTPKKRGTFLKVAVSFFAVYVAYAMIAQQAEIKERSEELAAVEALIMQQEEKNKDAERLLTLGDDEEYIERIAKEKLGYAYPDEHVYIDRSAE